MDAAYVFRVRFRLDPAPVTATPDEFETVVRNPAAAPGDDGWLFFLHNLWRGDVNDDSHAQSLAESWLSVPVVDVSFSELDTDEAYLDALKSEIAADLGRFNADNVSEVLNKYFGSSIRVR
ncbi:LWR-salt protein [Haloprofundus salinisoli]|uniref:LWR-salt protein n=1 Tax=Haloprofundus salinisoli TaxID=2876193 RepID=UPI001CCC998C|nr:LWR-salt protein [Haloprofundus salinisoli]